MNGIFKELIIPFFTGGAFIAFITYISNNVSIKYATIFVSINTSILTVLFIKSKDKRLSFVWNQIFLMLLISAMSIIYYILHGKLDISKEFTLLFSYLFLFIGTCIMYKYVLKN